MTPTSEDLRRTFAGARVLVTGHTGFKGSWLTFWLASLGAEVTGFALAPDTNPAMFELLSLADVCDHRLGDIRDREKLHRAISDTRPDFVFHLAAQPLVRRSYAEPIETIDVNVVGTANVLDGIRRRSEPCVFVAITSDKCYENREWLYGYRETDPLGGHDIYSMSKAAAELVVASYRRSFFPPATIDQHGVRVATVRAGNVIGGGDWAADRIVPDCIRSLSGGESIPVRNPTAIRPWQHVIEPLSGYLALACRLAGDGAARFCDAWNFGPDSADARPVSDLVSAIIGSWGSGRWIDVSDRNAPHEAGTLRLSIDKASASLGWRPRWDFDRACERTVEWYKRSAVPQSMWSLRDLTQSQIDEYMADEDDAEPRRQAAREAAH